MRLYSRSHLAVRHAASTDQTRYNLNGVHFKADGSVEATDGHMLARATAGVPPAEEFPTVPGMGESKPDTAPPEPFTLPLSVAGEVVKAIPKRTSMPVLQYAALEAGDNGSVRFGVTDLECPRVIQSQKVDAEYPTTDRVIPDKAEAPTFALDCSLLERACKIARDFTERRGTERQPKPGQPASGIALKFQIAKGNDAALKPIRIDVTDPDKGELLLVLMPVKL